MNDPEYIDDVALRFAKISADALGQYIGETIFAGSKGEIDPNGAIIHLRQIAKMFHNIAIAIEAELDEVTTNERVVWPEGTVENT